MAGIMATGKLAEVLTAQTSKYPSAWLAEGNLVLGIYPSVGAKIDFASEAVLLLGEDQDQAKEVFHDNKGRTTGDFTFTLRGVVHHCGSLRVLLREALSAMEDVRPGTLLKLENYKPRSKRPVSRDKNTLYDHPRLSNHCIEMRPGWFMATNNSAAEVKSYIQKARSLSGLREGEFSLSI